MNLLLCLLVLRVDLCWLGDSHLGTLKQLQLDIRAALVI